MKKLMLIGNLTADPELRTVQLQDGDVDVCSFGIAVNNGKDNPADFYRVTVWRGLATTCAQYLSKGKKIYIESDSFAPRLYTKKDDGSAGISFDVTASKVEFLSPRNEGDAPQQPAPQNTRQQPARQQQPTNRQQPARQQPQRQPQYNDGGYGGGYAPYDDDFGSDLPF